MLLLDFVGTFAFALSGALKAARRGLDLFGLIVLAVVTAIGGGTLRDLLLGVRPFWFADSRYVLLSVAAALIVFGLYRLVARGEMLLLLFDAIGLGVFTVIGATHAMSAGLGGIGIVVLATLTGIGGGMIRDLLAGDVPIVLRKEIYASASILGATVYWALSRWETLQGVAAPLAMALVILIRLLSLYYGLGLPKAPVATDAEASAEE